MTVFSLLWIAWLVAFGVIETVALILKDRPGHPATLSAHVWWLIRGAGPWHHAARVVLVAFLGWLSAHLLGGSP